MYPSPASSYQPQMPQQPPPPLPNQNYPSTAPAILPSSTIPTTSTSNYPYPQYNYNTNPTSSAHPGQPPLMPYGMSGNTAATMPNQQNNNVNGPPSVRTIFSFFPMK